MGVEGEVVGGGGLGRRGGRVEGGEGSGICSFDYVWEMRRSLGLGYTISDAINTWPQAQPPPQRLEAESELAPRKACIEPPTYTPSKSSSPSEPHLSKCTVSFSCREGSWEGTS
jgi:hypothetical protein